MTKVFFVSLGCDKNRVDSEVMLKTLTEHGYAVTDAEEEAKAAVVNTCCFIHDAKEESIGEILALGNRKSEDGLQALVVTGCMAERYREEIVKEIPEVDAVLGVAEEAEIAAVLDKLLGVETAFSKELPASKETEAKKEPATVNRRRILTTTSGYAYLKIAEGCDKHCTYCIIPKLRGAYRSVPMEDLVAEAKELAEDGVTELILVAQETTLYGTDLYGEKKLPELLRELCKIKYLRWIRLLYCYPEEITDELIDVLRTERKVLHYLDMPVQSGSDTCLKRMGRKTDAAQIRSLVAHLREQIPDICIRTTLITGFPGETREEARETYDLVKDLRFDRLGVFPYSREEGTSAYRMKNQVSEVTAKMRRTRLMKLQQQIAFEEAEAMVGSDTDVIIEGYLPEEDCYVARTYKDMPEVDGLFFLHVPEDFQGELLSGRIVRARITGASGYDLVGELI